METRTMAEKRQGAGIYWVRWAHDEGKVVHQNDRPDATPGDNGRDVKIHGPFNDEKAARARLEFLHSRCLKTITSRKAAM